MEIRKAPSHFPTIGLQTAQPEKTFSQIIYSKTIRNKPPPVAIKSKDKIIINSDIPTVVATSSLETLLAEIAQLKAQLSQMQSPTQEQEPNQKEEKNEI